MTDVRPNPAVAAKLYALIGVAVVIGVWYILAETKVFGTTVSTPAQVAKVFGNSDQRTTLLHGVRHTAAESLEGFGWAVLWAVVVGFIATLVPFLRKGLDQLGTILSAIPFVSLAPILLAIFDRPKVPSAMATCTAFFPIYLAFVSGMAAVAPSVSDLCKVLGASRADVLLRARIPAGLPVFTTGLKVAMPLAIVGAVIGEWLGSNGGVGPIMLVAMRGYKMPVMWATVVATVVLALILYGLCALVDRIATARFN